MKKNKSIIKRILIFGVASFICFNMVSCNHTKNEFIEVGLNTDNNSATEIIEMNPWYEFYTGLKAKTQKDKRQEIEVFYGNNKFLNLVLEKEYYEEINQKFEIDRSQVLELKLTRYVYPSDDAYLHNLFERSKDIFVMENTLGFFMSDEFRLEKNSMIDIIEAKDLILDYDKYGVISYRYVISTLENESIKIFIEDQPVYLGNYVPSYDSRIDYKIYNQNKIKFYERSRNKK